jgi:SAM-dependent methyltransferase
MAIALKDIIRSEADAYAEAIAAHAEIVFRDSEERAYFFDNWPRYRSTLEFLVKNSTNAVQSLRVLDIGIFPGHIACLLRFCSVGKIFGVSYNPPADFVERFAALDVPVLSLNVEVDPLPFESLSFDLVVATEIFEHVTYDLFFMLAEIERVLVRGGRLLVTTPNFARLSNRLLMLRGRPVLHPLDDPINPFFTADRDMAVWRHLREFTRGELMWVLERAGFEDVKVEWRDTRRSPSASLARGVKGVREFVKDFASRKYAPFRNSLFAWARSRSPCGQSEG